MGWCPRGGRLIRLTVKERILLHLLDHATATEAFEVPPAVTQEGIAEAAWIDVPHFAQYMRPLVRDGRVQERTAHVRGSARRRKTYVLTDPGKLEAIRLRAKLMAELVRVRDETGGHDERLADVMKGAKGSASVLQVLHQLENRGAIDLAELSVPAAPAFVEMLAEMPVLRAFAGRHKELERIAVEDGGPRILVVQGVAGIGKSSLAAKACELLRGKKNLFWRRVQTWDTSESLFAAVGDFLFALGRPGLRFSLSEEGLARAGPMMRQDLPGTHAFLIFDNAHKASPETLEFFRFLKDAVLGTSDVRVVFLTRSSLGFYDRRDVILAGALEELELVGLQPDEVMDLVSRDQDARPELIEDVRTVRGHPLFVELVRASRRRGFNPDVLHDVDRFIEEEIYAGLSEPGRAMMKLASLYRVPVPRDALCAAPGLTYDVLLSLEQRSLLRRVGHESFEAHETIQTYFAKILTPSERKELCGLAAQQLDVLAESAAAAGQDRICIEFLANAVDLAPSPDRRGELLEKLGDGCNRFNEGFRAMTAYRDAINAGVGRESAARLHAKRAWLFDGGAEFAKASEEAEAGFRALGDLWAAERGSLELFRCHLAGHLGEFEEGREHGESALAIFREFDLIAGQAQALAELGDIALIEAAAGTPGAIDAAATKFEAATELFDRLTEPELAVLPLFELHRGLAMTGKLERALARLEALWNSPGVSEKSSLGLHILQARAHLLANFRADYERAEQDLDAIIRIAGELRNVMAGLHNRDAMGDVLLYQGRVAEACAVYEQTAIEMLKLSRVLRSQGPLWGAALCYLLEGDVEGFRRVATKFEESNVPSSMEQVSGKQSLRRIFHPGWFIQGFDRLLRGDPDGAEDAFRAALSLPNLTQAYPIKSPFFYGIALRFLRRDREARELLGRATAIAERFGMKAMLAVMPTWEKGILKTLRKATKASRPGPPE